MKAAKMPEPKKKVVPIKESTRFYTPNEDSTPQAVFQDISGGGGDGDGTMTVGIKDYVDAKNEALESRVGGEFAALRADIEALPAKMILTVAAGVVAAVALVFAIWAYTDDRMDSGIAFGGSFGAQVEQNRANMDSLQQDVSKILDVVEVLAAEHEETEEIESEQGEGNDKP